MTSDEEREREAEWRWGNTDAYQQSAQRTAKYAPADWERIQREGGKLLDAMAALLKRGASAEGEEAMAIAELMREYNSRWFYDTSHEMHAMLADMYVADERFRKFYEDIAPGLAEFVSTAIVANALRAGANVSLDDALASVRAAMGFAPAPGDPIEPSTQAPTTTDATHAARSEGTHERRARALAARKRGR